MIYKTNDSLNAVINTLKVDCGQCFGLCCTALYFSASEGFPADKDAGTPCMNLQSDFKCKVHSSLKNQGFKGCINYDCLGAGQKVAQVSFSGQDWMQSPDSKKLMFDVFVIMRQLHEMLWYLVQALMLEPSFSLHDKLKNLLDETQGLTLLSPKELIAVDVSAHRAKIGALLQQASELVRAKVCSKDSSTTSKRKSAHNLDFIGADLRKSDLCGANFKGAYLIAANLRNTDLTGADFLAADLRDADIRGANLSDSLFVTQSQINSAIGDSSTKLPPLIAIPSHWSK